MNDNMTSNNDKPAIVFVAFPDAKLLDIAGPMQVFSDAPEFGAPDYHTALISIRPDLMITDTGIALSCEDAAAWEATPIDTLVIAGGRGALAASQDQALIALIKRLAYRSRRIGSICTGAFILAASGLLDGRRAVTHWNSCRELADRFPAVTVEPDRIFVRDGSIWTSAGVTAGIDMALAMVGEDAGRSVALDLARSLVTYMVRPGGQSQFSDALAQQSEDAAGRFDDLHAWITDNLRADLRVEALAEQAAMSPRTFARIYRSETGVTPAKAVERLRMEAVRRMLEQTDLGVTAIAWKSGFRDDERMRRAVHRALGVSPSEYRARFGKADTPPVVP